MDWYPLYNSVRIALLSTVIIFFAGIAAAYYVARLPRAVKGVLDAVFTLPLVLPPTVVGYLLLRMESEKAEALHTGDTITLHIALEDVMPLTE